MRQVPVQIAEGKAVYLSPGGQSVLIQQITLEFASRFTLGGKTTVRGRYR